jgi:hypothetical protein
LVVAIPWQGSCFGLTFNKPCQYNYSDTNVYMGLREVSLKATQSTLQIQITWKKKSSKGCANWEMACYNAGISH